jgi:hypothetical protein
MQLKIKRSQREGGVMSKTAIFCLDARAEFTQQELQSITRYKLHGQVIYNSEASRKNLENARSEGGIKGLASIAMAAMKLNITVGSLSQGQHIECKSLDELLGAEEAIMTACENLKSYLDTAATFDGREVLIDFDSKGPKMIAQATTPAPMTVAPAAPSSSSGIQETPRDSFVQQPHPAAPSYGTAAMTDSSYTGIGDWWKHASTGKRALAVVGVFIAISFFRFFIEMS